MKCFLCDSNAFGFESMDSEGWPVKRMSGDYLVYVFPYGARALQAERAKVQKVLQLSMLINYGWFPGGNQEPVFKVPLSFQEGFVRSDAERITLIDRVRNYHNFNWKRDVTGNLHVNLTDAEKHYTKLIDNLIEMQALTEELRPETLALVASCGSANELQQAMLNARA